MYAYVNHPVGSVCNSGRFLLWAKVSRKRIRSASIGFHQQLIGADIEAFGNSLDIVDRDITFTALDAAEIRPVHFDLEGKILLAHAARLTAATDIRRQNIPKRARMRPFHAA